MAVKKKLNLDVSEVMQQGEQSNVSEIHGKVVQISPVKTSRKDKDTKYIEGKMSDGKGVYRFVSFDVKVKDEIEAIMKEGDSVSVRNCAVRKSKMGEGLDIVIGKKSTVVNSPKRFKVDEAEMASMQGEASAHQLDGLHSIEDVAANCGNKVGIKGRIVDVKEKKEVKSKEKVLEMQECSISDSRDKAFRLVLWEESIGCLEKGKSYVISPVYVRAYQGVKYFSMSASDECKIEEIDCIDEVCEKVYDGKTTIIGEIVGIVSFAKFRACITCEAKVCDVNETIGECSKCRLKQKLNRCELNSSARVVLQDEHRNRHTVSVFTKMINQIVENYDTDDSTEEVDMEVKILCSGKKAFEINSGNVVVSVHDVEE